MSKRIEERVTYWRYKGQSKIHQTPYFVGLDMDAFEDAAAANDEAGYLESISEYNAACEAGRAVIVSEPT